MTDVSAEVQRWTAKCKAAVVMSIVKGETSAAGAGRKHIKFDIEGAKYDQLRGAAGVLSRLRPVIFVATPGAATRRLSCKLLDEAGFDVCPLDGGPLSDATESVALHK